MTFRTIGEVIGGRLGAILLLVLVLMAWPRSAAPLPDQRRGYVIEGVRVIDVVAGTAGPPASVVVRAGIVTAIERQVASTDLIRVDGRGAFLAPGLWDMHVHSFQLSPQMHFPLWVANGVTSVRDMMDCPDAEDSLIACVADKRRWNAEIEAGRLAAPRFVEIASYYLESPELTPPEAVALVRAYSARGIDAIKVYNRLPRAAYLRAAAEARAERMRLVGHLPKAVSLDEAVTAGQSSFEHAHVLAQYCFRLAAQWRQGALDQFSPTKLAEAIVAEHDPAACGVIFDTMRSAGTWYVPTHVTREDDARAGEPSFVDDPRLDYLDPLSRWAYRDDLAGTRSKYPGDRGERGTTERSRKRIFALPWICRLHNRLFVRR